VLLARRHGVAGFSRELLDSKWIIPKHALDAGFVFQFPSLRGALTDVLK
jgi:NAD dependent epimerase/dehydratase family enzyme